MRPDRRNGQSPGQIRMEEENATDRNFENGHRANLSTGLVARFTPDGYYDLDAYGEEDELGGGDLVLNMPQDPALTDRDLAEIHRILAARAPCYAAASSDQERSSILALTRLDTDHIVAHGDEEAALLFYRFLETGDTSPP